MDAMNSITTRSHENPIEFNRPTESISQRYKITNLSNIAWALAIGAAFKAIKNNAFHGVLGAGTFLVTFFLIEQVLKVKERVFDQSKHELTRENFEKLKKILNDERQKFGNRIKQLEENEAARREKELETLITDKKKAIELSEAQLEANKEELARIEANKEKLARTNPRLEGQKKSQSLEKTSGSHPSNPSTADSHLQ